jgi:hypothetical protein
MTTATRTLKAPRHMSRVRNVATKKPARFVRVLSRDAMGNVAAFQIKTGFVDAAGVMTEKKLDTYACDLRPEGDGFVATVEKHGGERPYSVRVSEATGNSCECDGWKWGGKCRHVSALLEIAARDQQKPRPAMVCCDMTDCHDE